MLALAIAFSQPFLSMISHHVSDSGSLMGFLGLLKLPCCAVLLAAFALVAPISMFDLHEFLVLLISTAVLAVHTYCTCSFHFFFISRRASDCFLRCHWASLPSCVKFDWDLLV
jgi:hypothetical protein